MQKQPMISVKTSQNGIALIEALVAIAIFSFGILALVGLQALMLKSTTTSKMRSDASYIAQKRVGEMWADSANLANYIETDTDISSLIPSGLRTVQLVAGTQYEVTVGWTLPGETIEPLTAASCGMNVAHCFTTVANIAGA